MTFDREYDVMVAGAGVAGVVAATQAARSGARTLLVERLSRVGGTALAADVPYPALFHAFGRRIVGGIGWEWMEHALKEEGRPLPEFDLEHSRNNRHSIRVDMTLFALTGEELLARAGVSFLRHAMPSRLRRADGGGWRVEICGKEGPFEIGARMLIDATGDANLARLAGCALWREPEPQPATLVARLDGYDFEKIDKAAMRAAYDQARAAGKVEPADFGWVPSAACQAAAGREVDPDGWQRCEGYFRSRGGNSGHVRSGDASTSEGRSDLEARSQLWLLELLRRFRKVPGLEGLRIASLPQECGVRETDRIVGETPVTDDAYESGRVWPDAVGYSFYPVDIHVWGGNGLIFKTLDEGVVPTIPLGAMRPKGEGRLLACGRCVSGERRAYSAYRTMATCMVTGQAAGAVAALAARAGTTTDGVPTAEWRAELLHHGAILP